jgi:hypothetical protein
MTAALADRAPTTAEREQPALVAELEHMRALLVAFRDGAPPPAPPEPSGPEPALDRLARLLELSAFERRVLLLAAAVELDAETALLVADLKRHPDPRPTFGLALAALPGAHWDALAPRSPLRRWRLLDTAPAPTLASRPLRIDERILHYLTGLPASDERLDGVLRVDERPALLSPSQVLLADELARSIAAAGADVAVAVEGEDVDARLGVARALAAALGGAALLVRREALPTPGPDLAGIARLIDREALLLPGLPVLEADDLDAGAAALLDELEAPVVVVAGEAAILPRGRVAFRRAVGLPDPAEARVLWARSLGEPVARALAGPIDEVSHHFRLSAAAVDVIARELSASGEDGTAALTRLCRTRTRVPLEGLADRIEPVARWDDLVLPEGHLELLHEIARQVRHRTRVYEDWGFAARGPRGLGVTALFAGESGTGKTLAAEIIAGELGLDLYRIDLAATVSKYIGETEKNLRRLFDAAEASGAVLLFDEADALFGRRGEVKDAHDRYANLEVAYLLQRMESYRGLALLTTNLRSNVDRAFVRRLRFVVQFPFPDVAERRAIWSRAFPDAIPRRDLDLDALAQLVVSGGSIRSIALSAAFAAAGDGGAVTPEHLRRAARLEFAKAERPPPDWKAAGLA